MWTASMVDKSCLAKPKKFPQARQFSCVSLPAYTVENETMPDAVSTKEKVEELKQDTEIQKALNQAAVPQKAASLPGKRRRKF
jgi:hypothetical protein